MCFYLEKFLMTIILKTLTSNFKFKNKELELTNQLHLLLSSGVGKSTLVEGIKLEAMGFNARGKY